MHKFNYFSVSNKGQLQPLSEPHFPKVGINLNAHKCGTVLKFCLHADREGIIQEFQLCLFLSS